MMNTKSYSEIQEVLNQQDLTSWPQLNFFILRNIILEPIEPLIRYLAFQTGFNANVTFGNYDNVFQEAVGGHETLKSKACDCVLVFLKLEALSWDLARNFTGLNHSQIQNEIERVEGIVKNIIEGIRKQTQGMILWHSFELPIDPAYGIIDRQQNDSQLKTVQRLNDYIVGRLGQHSNSYLVDMNLCLMRVGAKNFYDPRYWYIGRAPYSRNALREIVHEEFKFIRTLKGKNKKCLVLDCDNTLWGGIVGEEGLNGIQLSKTTYPGSIYYELQQEILNLYHRGVILAICSKNNEEDVWEVFREHPDMLLKEEHIAVSQINWSNKADNLRDIADRLNIGLDSLVMLDDSEFEVNLIRRTLPEVYVLHLSRESISEYRNTVASLGLFDSIMISEEDKKRGMMYKAESVRHHIKKESANLEDYFLSLEMTAKIGFANEFSIPRIAQLTHKTNQFNLTTKRYAEGEIRALADDHQSDVIYMQLGDKCSDLGIIGVCILKYAKEDVSIDTFLLSCRALGRHAENLFLTHALALARYKQKKIVFGEYISTRKNGQVEYFYEKCGFQKMTSDETIRNFKLDLDNFKKYEPTFYKQIDSEISDNLKYEREYQ